MEINFESTFEEIKDKLGIVCESDADAAALIFAADRALSIGARALAARPDAVPTLWAWLEKTNIEIFTDFSYSGKDSDFPRLSAQINAALKKGANGAHLFAHTRDWSELSEFLIPVASDLFFGRKLIMSLDICDVEPLDWEILFRLLSQQGAAGMGLFIENSEAATGTIYGMLQSMPADFDSEIHVISKDNSFMQIENFWRLTGKLRPEILKKTLFFIPMNS